VNSNQYQQELDIAATVRQEFRMVYVHEAVVLQNLTLERLALVQVL
jgi:hypothetical protein